MNISYVKREISNLKEELLEILQKYYNNEYITENDEIEIKKKILNSYKRYLKICVCLDKKVPDYNNGIWPYQNNCYCYSLDFRKPKIFQDIYTEIFYKFFSINLGEISEVNLPRMFTEKDFFNSLYADLDFLKIKHYESSFDKDTIHGGYKIAIYMRDTKDYYKPDYHFVRQNSNGLWSEKYGSNEKIYVINNLDHLSNHPNYRYIKTLELVKPCLKELSL